MDTIYEFNNTKELVLELLEREERCRNDDKWLTFRVMQHFTKIYIPFEDFSKIPSFETVKRTRAIIQNKEGKYQPTSPEVILKRQNRSSILELWTPNRLK